MIDTFLRARAADLGIDPFDRAAVADLAAVGATLIAWRNGPAEEWHQQRSWLVSNPELMRTNAATTRAVRKVLGTHLPAARWLSEGSMEDGARMFGDLASLFSDARRRLPGGQTVGEWDHDRSGLEDLHAHVKAAVRRWLVLTAEYELGPVILMLACAVGYDRPRWWLTPWWPAYVDEFLRRIDKPGLWSDAVICTAVARLRPPPEVADREVLRQLLLSGTDQLSAASATYCWRAHIGHTPLARPLPNTDHRDYMPVRDLVDPRTSRTVVRDARNALSDLAYTWAVAS